MPSEHPQSSRRPLLPLLVNQNNASHRSSSTNRELDESQMFILFIKVLLLYARQVALEKNDRADRPLHKVVQAVVSECTRGNRRGDPAYTPLMEVTELKLRKAIGNDHYLRAKLYFDTYCRSRGIQANLLAPLQNDSSLAHVRRVSLEP